MDADADRIDGSGTDATDNNYVFERIRLANKKQKKASNRRLISRTLDTTEQTSYTQVNNDDNFSSYDYDSERNANVEYDEDVDDDAQQPHQSESIWLYLKALLTNLVDKPNIDQATNEQFNFPTHSKVDSLELENDFDYLDDSNYYNIFDTEWINDENSQKHKILKQKILGNFSIVYFFAIHRNSSFLYSAHYTSPTNQATNQSTHRQPKKNILFLRDSCFTIASAIRND